VPLSLGSNSRLLDPKGEGTIYILSKHQELFTHQQITTSKKTVIFGDTTVRTSNLGVFGLISVREILRF